MPSEHDERKWHGYGEQEFLPLRGCTTWSGPVLRQGERVTVVPEARALAAEQRVQTLSETKREHEDRLRAAGERIGKAEQRADREQRLREQADRARDNALALAALRRDERDKAEEARGEAFKEETQRHDDLLRERKSAEQRVAELERDRLDIRNESIRMQAALEEAWKCRAESAETLLPKAVAALDEMRLHENTGDPHDLGYMAAVNEFSAVLAEIAKETT